MVPAFLLSAVAVAGDVRIIIVDEKKQPVSNAVVSLKPLFEGATGFSPVVMAEMRQQGVLFSPFVLPIAIGSTVSFPNFDEFRHHVYSFSDVKRFELRLYGQDESKAIQFDTAGVVALGCNIHDNMLAYIYVSEHPVFAKTDENGQVDFSGLATGQYELYVWHPDLKGGKSKTLATLEIANSALSETVSIALRTVRRKQLPPGEDDYN